MKELNFQVLQSQVRFRFLETERKPVKLKLKNKSLIRTYAQRLKEWWCYSSI